MLMCLPVARFISLPALIFFFCNSVSANETQKREFTVRDSVEMSYFGNIADSTPTHSYDDGTISPNGRYIAKMTHRGVLPKGVSEGTIWLFPARKVLASVNDQDAKLPSPTALVRMSATVNGQSNDFDDWGNILLHLRWSNDSTKLFFIGRDGNESRQLFEVDLESGGIKRLSLPNQNVMSYLLGRDSIVYWTSINFDERQEWLSAGLDIPDVTVGTGTPLVQLLYPNFRGYAFASALVSTAWQVARDGPKLITDASTDLPLQVESNYLEVAGVAAGEDTYASMVERLSTSADWQPVDRNARRRDSRLEISVREALNQAPVLVATDIESGLSRQIFDPNPQLANLKMADVKVFEWLDMHGRTHSGGLVLPAGYEEGRRYSLVLQTHGFNRNRFFKVGYSETVNAGRALAGRNIVVLQVQEPWPDRDGIHDPKKLGSDVYLSAIDKLHESGLVDRNRVGISGYSFSGWLAADAITREPDRFAAAVIANSDPLSLTGYFSYVDSPLHGEVEKRYVGIAPFGDGLDEWRKRSPNLNTDKISAPVLVAALDPVHLISLWDLYAALRYQGKPVELQFIRTGQHNVVKPLQVLAHQQLIVDWFDFWLNGAESPDQDKSAQYSRWRKMRANRDDVETLAR